MEAVQLYHTQLQHECGEVQLPANWDTPLQNPRNTAINIIFFPLLYPVTVKSTVHYSFKHHVFDAFATSVATSIFHHVFELLP